MFYKKIFFKLFLLAFVILNIGSIRAQDTTTLIQKVNTKLHQVKNPIEVLIYNKLIITANPDSIKGTLDTIYKIKKNPKVIKKIDSSAIVFKKILRKSHLFQTEKIAQLYSNKNGTKEIILATKMAGFKEPIAEYFSLQFQPLSLTAKKIKILTKQYPNPISKLGQKQYHFTIQDTIYIKDRKVYVLHFISKKIKDKNTLNGNLYIDAVNYAIAKIEIKNNATLRFTCIYELSFDAINNDWIPKKTSIHFVKGYRESNLTILGETINFEPQENILTKKPKKFTSDYLQILSTTHYFNYKKSTLNHLPQNYISIEIKKGAIDRKENLWYDILKDSLDKRSDATYTTIDSITNKLKIEKKISIGRKILKGYYPIGFFDLNLRYLFSANNYEGIRTGLGGVTNDKLSKDFKTSIYCVYGTKDYDFKWGISNAYLLNQKTETWLGLSYKEDVNEIANTTFEIDRIKYKLYNPRPLNLTTFYAQKSYKVFVETQSIPKTQSIFLISRNQIQPRFAYAYLHNNIAYNSFVMSLFTASVQWNPFSKYMLTPNRIIEIDKIYPRFTLQYTQSIPGLQDNSFGFLKFDFRTEYEKKTKYNGKWIGLLKIQYANGDVPITHLYNHCPNNLNKEAIARRITFAGKDGFETMYFNEFFSDKHLFLQLEHAFAKLEITPQIQPCFSLISRYGIGSLNNKENHKNITFKTLEKGYLESGLEINKIYKGLGIGTYYRYGGNQLPQLKDNIAIKISFEIDLGFNN